MCNKCFYFESTVHGTGMGTGCGVLDWTIQVVVWFPLCGFWAIRRLLRLEEIKEVQSTVLLYFMGCFGCFSLSCAVQFAVLLHSIV